MGKSTGKGVAVTVLPEDERAFEARALEFYQATVRGTPGGPPDDPNFFRAFRLQMSGSLEAPYVNYPWVYAGVGASAVPISQLNFVLYKEATTNGRPQTDAKSIERRASKMREVCPRLPKARREWIASMGQPRRRTRELRRAAPWLTGYELVRAVEDIEPVEKGPWNDLLERPNPTMTLSQLWELTIIYMLTEGETFWMLIGGGAKDGGKVTETGIPTEIWPSSPCKWGEDIDPKTHMLRRWLRKRDANDVKGDPWETYQVVHPKLPNPHNPLRGLSPLLPIKTEIESDWQASVFNLAFLKNGGMPGGWLSTEGRWTPEQAKEWLRDFEARHGGPKKAGRPALLTGGVKFEPSSTSHRDMQYATLRDNARDVILSAGFRTTKAMVGLASDHNKSTIDTAVKNHWDSVLLPKVYYLEDILDLDLFTKEREKTGGGVMFGLFDLSTVPALKENLTEQLAAAKDMQSLGYTTNQINEALEMNLPDLPWGNQAYIPNTLLAIGDDGKPETAGPDPDEPDPEQDPKKGKKPKAGKTEDGEEEAPEKAAGDEPKKALARGAALSLKTPEHWGELVERVFAPGEEKYQGRFKAFLHQLRTEQLRLGKTLFDLRTWKGKLREEMTPTYRFLVGNAAKVAEDELARLRKAASGRVIVARATDGQVYTVADGMAVRVGRVVKTIRGQLEALIAEAEKEGSTDAAIAAAIKAQFNQWATKGKVQVISRTETGGANAQARNLIFRDNDVQESEWLTAEDELVRDNHVIYGDADPQPIGFNYATLAGEAYKLQYPHDPDAPAGEVVNCRCVSVPVIKP